MFQLRLLVADGDRETTDRLRVWLAGWGYDAHVATTGTEALKVAGYHLPHVALLDLALPEMDGLRVTRLLDRRTTRVGIIAPEQERDRPHEWDAEFRSFLTRPVDAGQLHQLLVVLESEHAHSEAHELHSVQGRAAPGSMLLLAADGDFMVRRAPADRPTADHQPG